MTIIYNIELIARREIPVRRKQLQYVRIMQVHLFNTNAC